MALETENIACDYDTVFKGVKATIACSALGYNYIAYEMKDGKESIAGFMYTMKELSLMAGGFIIWINDTYVPVEYRR